MAKKFVKTTTAKWGSMSNELKSNYSDSIVFIQNDTPVNSAIIGAVTKGNYILLGNSLIGGGIDMDVVKSSGSMEKYIDSGSLGIDISGYLSASIGTVPSRTSTGISWVELPSSNSETNIIYDNGNLDLNGGSLKLGDKTIIDSSGNLILASDTLTGGIKVSSVNTSTVAVNSESTTAGRYYPVELNSDGKAIVNVPWTDNDTKNTAGATNSSSKLYLIGSTSLTANPQTNSSSKCYTLSGKLYSDSAEVLTLKIYNKNKPIQFGSTADNGTIFNNYNSYSAHCIAYNSYSAAIYPNPLIISQPYTMIDMMVGDFVFPELIIVLNSLYRVNTNYSDSTIINDLYSSYIEIYLNDFATHMLQEIAFNTVGDTYVSNITTHIHIYNNRAESIKDIPFSSGLYANYYDMEEQDGFVASKSILKIHCCYKPTLLGNGSFEIECHQYVY